MANTQRKNFDQIAASKGLSRKTISILQKEDFDTVDAIRVMDLRKDLPTLHLEVTQQHIIKTWVNELNGVWDPSGGFAFSRPEPASFAITDDQMCFSNLRKKVELIEEMKQHLSYSGMKDFRETVNSKLSPFSKLHSHVCIVGDSYVGKSSLIASLLRIPKERINQKSNAKQVVPYSSSEFPGAVFWDYPTSLVKNQIDKLRPETDVIPVAMFDAMIICSCRRFSELDFNLAKIAREYMLPLCYVRTKLDNDIANDKRDRGQAFNEASLIQAIKTDAANNLKEAGIKTDSIFILSTFSEYRNKWDFPELVKYQKGMMHTTNCSSFLYHLQYATLNFCETKHKELSKQMPIFTKDIMTANEQEQKLQTIMNTCSREYGMEPNAAYYQPGNFPYQGTTPVHFTKANCISWRLYICWLVGLVLLGVLAMYFMLSEDTEHYGRYCWYAVFVFAIGCIVVFIWNKRKIDKERQNVQMKNEAMCEDVLRKHIDGLFKATCDLGKRTISEVKSRGAY